MIVRGRLVDGGVTADGPVDYLGPLPFRVSRDRVTVEDAPVTFLKPAHLGSKILEGWLLHVAHTCVQRLSRFDLWSSSRCMPEAKNEHRIWIAKQFVNDAIRSIG